MILGRATRGRRPNKRGVDAVQALKATNHLSGRRLANLGGPSYEDRTVEVNTRKKLAWKLDQRP
jgi:hypothetical protein